MVLMVIYSGLIPFSKDCESGWKDADLIQHSHVLMNWRFKYIATSFACHFVFFPSACVGLVSFFSHLGKIYESAAVYCIM